MIYVNDIADNLLIITRLFADDTSLAFLVSNVKYTEGILIIISGLRMIAVWTKHWLVSFNPSKTVAKIFLTVLDLVKPSLLLNNTIIEFVDNHKHLVVHNMKKTKLERIQHEAARLVTGLTRSVSIENLMKEIEWLSLSDRRHFQKALTMFKIKIGLAPNYLNNLLPPLVQ